MKKSTIIMLISIYFASIIAISFFGLRPKIYDEVIPAESISLTHEIADNIKTQEDTSNTYDEIFIIDLLEGERNILVLKPTVQPYNATNKNYVFTYKKDDDKFLFNEIDGREDGTIEFFDYTKTSALAITIKSADGRSSAYKILIWINPA